MSHGFWGLGFCEQLSWVVQAQGMSWGCSLLKIQLGLENIPLSFFTWLWSGDFSSLPCEPFPSAALEKASPGVSERRGAWRSTQNGSHSTTQTWKSHPLTSSILSWSQRPTRDLGSGQGWTGFSSEDVSIRKQDRWGPVWRLALSTTRKSPSNFKVSLVHPQLRHNLFFSTPALVSCPTLWAGKAIVVFLPMISAQDCCEH